MAGKKDAVGLIKQSSFSSKFVVWLMDSHGYEPTTVTKSAILKEVKLAKTAGYPRDIWRRHPMVCANYSCQIILSTT